MRKGDVIGDHTTVLERQDAAFVNLGINIDSTMKINMKIARFRN